MAGITFTIGEQAFGALSSGSGRFALDCDPGFPAQSVHRFHLPGTVGQLKVLGGTAGRQLRFIARYRGANVAAIGALTAADREAWSDAEVSVTTDEGETLSRCTVVSMRRMGRIRGTGRGVASVDYEIVVQADNGV